MPSSFTEDTTKVIRKSSCLHSNEIVFKRGCEAADYTFVMFSNLLLREKHSQGEKQPLETVNEAKNGFLMRY